MNNLNVLVFGSSRNIGYYASLRLLRQGAKVTLLIRDLDRFDEKPDVKHYIALGKVVLVKGDALSPEDVKAAWDKAAEQQKIDFVLFTIGANPTFSPTKGYIMRPPNLCTHSILNILCTMPKLPSLPKFIVISTAGITKESRERLPILLKPVYNVVLSAPQADKVGVERILAHCAGNEWTDDEPRAEITSTEQKRWTDREGLPIFGAIKEIVIIRPAILTDGRCTGDKSEHAYRVSDGPLDRAFAISRKDVSHFMVEKVIKKWSEFEGRTVDIAY